MSKSAMLRVPDVCAVYRLIGDCRDVGGDPAQWQQMALEGLCRLVGGCGASGGEGVWLRPSEPLRPMTSCVVGFDDSGRERYLAYMQEQGILGDPIYQRIQHLPDRIVTRTRRDLVPDDEWYRSVSFNEYRKEGGNDHQLTSVYQVAATGEMSGMGVLRALGDRDFTTRERCLASFFHVELGALIGRALVSAIEPSSFDRLSPRLRQTLDCLVDGDSEKQVAARLSLSRSTVHQYITMLYRRFGVQSRPELMSYVFKRRQRLPVVPETTD